MAASQQAPDAPLPRIVAAAVTSVIERADKNSKYVFQVEVRCSDGTQSTCFRGYQDFFDFHCQLLDQFPEEAGTTKGSNRVVPYLPGKKIFRRSTKSLALQRLPQLHQYSQELIALPDNISNSTLVINFFKDDWREDTMQYFKNKDTPTSQHQTHSEGQGTDDVQELSKSIQAVNVNLTEGCVVSYSPDVRCRSPDSSESTQLNVPSEDQSDVKETSPVAMKKTAVIEEEEDIDETQRQDPTILEEEQQDPTILEEERQDPTILEGEQQDPTILEEEKQDPTILEEEKQDPTILEVDPTILEEERQDPAIVNFEEDKQTQNNKEETHVSLISEI